MRCKTILMEGIAYIVSGRAGVMSIYIRIKCNHEKSPLFVIVLVAMSTAKPTPELANLPHRFGRFSKIGFMKRKSYLLKLYKTSG